MISIIIPTYQEGENIGPLVGYLKKHATTNTEIIVSDGGSIDETVYLAQSAGAMASRSPQKGRAAQMNHGASLAKGSTLFFVHADTFPPQSFCNDITDAITNGFGLGRYRTAFNSPSLILRLNALVTRFDLFVCYGGDQTLFIKKELFDQIGGFNADMRIMEDYDITVRARKLARYAILPANVMVSARKYDTNSWWRVQKANYAIVQMYKKGASQEAMVKQYRAMLDYR